MGAARRHLDCLAAPARRLARQVRGIPWVYADIVSHLHQSERVHLLVNDAAAEHRVKKLLARLRAVDLGPRWPFSAFRPTASGLAITAPIFVRDPAGQARRVRTGAFNAWAKYNNWQRDDAVPTQAAAQLGLQIPGNRIAAAARRPGRRLDRRQRPGYCC